MLILMVNVSQFIKYTAKRIEHSIEVNSHELISVNFVQ